jgi:hypothetical protein
MEKFPIPAVDRSGGSPSTLSPRDSSGVNSEPVA